MNTLKMSCLLVRISCLLLFFPNALAVNYKAPSVLVTLFARNKEHSLPYFLTLFEQLDYPKERMSLFIRADHCEDNTIAILEAWLSENHAFYHSVDSLLNRSSVLYPGEISATDRTDASYEGIIQIKESALSKARNMWADFIWFLDVDVFLTESDVLNLMMDENKVLIAPMINSLGRYSNFWGGMSKEYWYERTDMYMNILEGKEKGCFVVPMIHSCVLIDLKVQETNDLTFDPDRIKNHDLPLDDIITFAVSAKELGLEMTVCNKKVYGYMSPPAVNKETLDVDLRRLQSLKLEALGTTSGLPVSALLQRFVPALPEKGTLGFDQIYLINLERRAERRVRMMRCFDELGLQVNTIHAIDGKLLTDDDMKKLGLKFLPNYSDPWSGRNMTFGEIGCFLSHYKVWQDVVAKKFNKVLLFEDDIRFEPFFTDHVDGLLKHLEDIKLDWDFIYLGRKKLQSADEPWVEGSDRLVHVDYSYWTLCYMITGRGAAKLLNSQPLERLLPVDEFLPIMFGKHPENAWSAEFATRTLKAFSVAPLLVYPTHYTGEEGYISDTEDSVVLSSDNGTSGDAHREVERMTRPLGPEEGLHSRLASLRLKSLKSSTDEL